MASSQVSAATFVCRPPGRVPSTCTTRITSSDAGGRGSTATATLATSSASLAGSGPGSNRRSGDGGADVDEGGSGSSERGVIRTVKPTVTDPGPSGASFVNAIGHGLGHLPSTTCICDRDRVGSATGRASQTVGGSGGCGHLPGCFADSRRDVGVIHLVNSCHNRRDVGLQRTLGGALPGRRAAHGPPELSDERSQPSAAAGAGSGGRSSDRWRSGSVTNRGRVRVGEASTARGHRRSAGPTDRVTPNLPRFVMLSVLDGSMSVA